MSSVKVQSIDSIKLLRASLLKFAEGAETVIGEAECEMQGLMTWLETEADTHWRFEIRKRQEAVTQAKAALRSKKMFKSDLSQRSVVDEEKALRLAQQRLMEAEATLEAVHRYGRILQKEVDQYRGQVQRLAGSVTIELPLAAAKLEALMEHLYQYLAVAPMEVVESDEDRAVGGIVQELSSMARAEPGEEDQETRGQGDKESGTPDPKSKIQNPKSGVSDGAV